MTGTGWVFGALLGILAVALVIAGATGHGTQLFQGITGKTAGSTSSSGASSTSATTAIDAALTGLASTGAQSPSSGAGASPYSGLGPATTTSTAGAV